MTQVKVTPKSVTTDKIYTFSFAPWTYKPKAENVSGTARFDILGIFQVSLEVLSNIFISSITKINNKLQITHHIVP